MGHGFRGFLTAALGLIALQTVASNAAGGRIAGLFGVIADGVNRALDPSIPLIPDRRGGGSSGGPGATTNTSTPYRTPADLAPSAPIGSLPPARFPVPGIPVLQ
jgi:hypothetical protein